MILSFSVILIECTNEISLGLPILLTLMVRQSLIPILMKHYCAKPSAQLPKHIHILLHCCYKLADNHLTLFQLHIRAVKAISIIHAALLLNTCKP